jgi:hypothetical protein
LHKTASKLASENEITCPVLDRDRNIGRFVETLARLPDHRRGDVRSRDVAGRADGGKSRFGGEPSARGYVKDAHARRNVRCAQQEGHEVYRNVRERPVVLCRRLIFEAEFLWHPRLCLFSSESKGRFPPADRWRQGLGTGRPS